MEVHNIGRLVFVNRGADIVQRGKISAHVVSTKEVRDGEIEITVQYEVKFPFAPPSRFDDDQDSPPFNRVSYFDAKNVYLSLEEAFAETHNVVS